MPVVASPHESLEASLRRLVAKAAPDLPLGLEDPNGTGPQDWCREAQFLARRHPHSRRAWSVCALCETRAGSFGPAERSYRRAGDPIAIRQARRRTSIAFSLRRKGRILAVESEGCGYWLVATGTTSHMGSQRLLELGPDGRCAEIFAGYDPNAGEEGMQFGLRRLGKSRKRDLIVEAYTWLSNGGECELAILSGGRGHWVTRFHEPGFLWEVHLIDLDHDGRYELGVRHWVWYKGPQWKSIDQFRGGSLVDITWRYPKLIQRQLREVRRAIAEDLPERRVQDRREATSLLQSMGHRL